MQQYSLQRKKSKENKSRKVTLLPQKAKEIFFESLDDFIKGFPINRYGEPVISGRRIC